MNRSMLKRLFGAVALALFVSALTGCGPEYDRTEISAVKGQGTLGGGVSVQRLDVPEGMILTAKVVVWNDDNEQMSLNVRAKDTSIIEINPVVNARNYAFIGKKAGTTAIEVLGDGEVVLTIPATVTAQPEPAKTNP